MEDGVQPVLDLWVAPSPDSGFVSQDVAIKGRPALLELLVDLTEESSALPEILSSQTGAVDLVPVLPHPPHGQPDLVDELGSPGVPSVSTASVGVVDLLMGTQRGVILPMRKFSQPNLSWSLMASQRALGPSSGGGSSELCQWVRRAAACLKQLGACCGFDHATQ